jgi:hypothetical protein
LNCYNRALVADVKAEVNPMAANDYAELRGIICGRTIQLEHDAGLPEGQAVTVLLHPVAPLGTAGGIAEIAGAWADAGADLDDWLAEMRRGRDLSEDHPLP